MKNRFLPKIQYYLFLTATLSASYRRARIVQPLSPGVAGGPKLLLCGS